MKFRYLLISAAMVFNPGCSSQGNSNVNSVIRDSVPFAVGELNVSIVGALENDRASDLLVVAHRSCWRLAPENSIKAMDECISLGADLLEIDVRRSRDNQLIAKG